MIELVVERDWWEVALDVALAVLTFAAVVVAAIAAAAAAKSARDTREMVGIERDRRDEERAAAQVANPTIDVVQHVVEGPGGKPSTRTELTVYNPGPARATGVTVHLEKTTDLPAPNLLGEDRFPVDLEAGGRFTCDVSAHLGSGMSNIHWRWVDGRGEQRRSVPMSSRRAEGA